jgi:methionyl-tRNA formyltransferase
VAVPPLRALVADGHEVRLVVTRADKRRGRGGALMPSPVKAAAQELGLRVTDQVDDVIDAGAELGVVVAFGRLIKPHVLAALPMVNVHFSLLPRWRGAAPIQRAILAGDEVSGVTIMRMDEGLDTGPMLLKRELDIRDKNAGQATEELAKLGAAALIEWLDHPAPPQPQPEDGVSYASKIDKAEARIDWSQSAEQIERQVRAFNPVPGAWFEANGERIKLLEAIVGTDAAGKPGEVLDDCVNVACGEGYIRPLKVQRAGRAAMTPGELLRGFPIQKGTSLS